MNELSSVPFELRLSRAMKDMRAGHPVILVDNLDRENEADLVVAAERLSERVMALLIRECSGIVCLCLPEEKLCQLELPQMVANNESCYQTAFTVTIDARYGISTGVSAADRVCTIRAAIARDAAPEDLVRPGHVFPLRAVAGGVLARQGHTEGAVELAKLAGLPPAAVLCEVTNPDGTMAKGADIVRFADKYGCTVLSISELIAYRNQTEFRQSLVAC
jgi:3,4-dihydroxy 2-butanone 4-phosphate synthase